MRVSTVGMQERDTPTHLIKSCNSTHDGHVCKDRLVMTDGTQQLVEAFYTHDDVQTISTCSYTSCREPALWPTITDSTHISL